MTSKRSASFRRVLEAYKPYKEHMTLREYLTKFKLNERYSLTTGFFEMMSRPYELETYDDFLVIHSYFNKCSQRHSNSVLRNIVELSKT